VPKKKQTKPPETPASFQNRPFKESLKPLAAEKKRAVVTPPLAETKPALPDKKPPKNSDPFAELMKDVAPLKRESSLLIPAWTEKPAPRNLTDEELVMRHLDGLVHGHVEFDLNDSDEYIEACVSGFDRHTLQRLRAGDFAIQADLDLHGFRREEAHLKVAAFIEKSAIAGLRCVLIVHGRGLGSRDNIPVLKENLRLWLTRGAIARRVLAYTSARPFDGGTGAVYVLLRHKGKEKFKEA
jgi:DNA-nicking Smr family endonuclease